MIDKVEARDLMNKKLQEEKDQFLAEAATKNFISFIENEIKREASEGKGSVSIDCLPHNIVNLDIVTEELKKLKFEALVYSTQKHDRMLFIAWDQ